jgi:hypothetical protein
MKAIEALAEAWASIDGKLEAFRHGRAHPNSPSARRDGYYEGYLEDAAALARRLKERGFVLQEVEGGAKP